MSRAEQQDWDERFRSGSHSGSEPDPFVERINDFTPLFSESRKALEVACGAGRHAVWLAEQRWQVTACDISHVGLLRAKALAAERGVRVDLFCQDLDDPSLPSSRYDLAVCFFYLQRSLFPLLKGALRPGGLILYKTYTTDQRRFSGGPTHGLHLLQPQELLHAFRDFRILHYEETVKDRGVAQLIGQKMEPGTER